MEALEFIQNNLYIQDKAGQLRPFIFNPAQRRLYDEVRRQQNAGKPVRIIILKARQIGFSTAIAGLFYQRAVTCPNINAMIVAHKAEASANIFAKTKLFYECSPEELRPLKKASNSRELLFENPSSKAADKQKDPGLRSRIHIETAGNKDAGRSATIQLLHLSELAFWPYAEQTMVSLMQAVPDLPETMIIMESTAGGVGGAFYKQWQRAQRGESAFVPLFFPWQEHGAYQRPDDGFLPSADEEQLAADFSLSRAQLAWRRWCIDANCGGDEEIFAQEYPACPEEAFLRSGRPVFRLPPLAAAYAQAAPGEQGRLELKNGRALFQPGPGWLRVYQPPQPGCDYVIGCDVAAGYRGGDYSALCVVERTSRRVVALWHGHCDPELLAEEAFSLALFYQRALLVPEVNNHGVAVINGLKRLNYGHVWRRGSESGWLTTAKSKRAAISALAQCIREDASRLADRGLIEECMSYVYDEKGAMNAKPGSYDDRVMACALALAAIGQHSDGQRIAEENWGALYGADATTGY